jgi:hypothetical protein
VTMFPGEAKWMFKLELIHGDPCGPIMLATPTSKKYFFLLIDHCIKHDIQCHLNAPYTLEQNGVVERQNQSILGMAKSMMKAMSIPGWL